MWVIYVVRCADDSRYCGITNDLPARLAAHEAGKGAKYTRGRGPLTLVASVRCRDKRVALRTEHAVKRLTRPEKLALDAQAMRRLVTIAQRQLRADILSSAA